MFLSGIRYLVLALILSITNSSFGAEDQQSDCHALYDPSIALKLSAEYKEALKARDFARLKQLKAKKKELDLWAKNKVACSPGSTDIEPGSDPDSGAGEDIEPTICQRVCGAQDHQDTSAGVPHLELARMSECVYDIEQCDLQDDSDWTALDDPQLRELGLSPGKFGGGRFNLSGFHADLFYNPTTDSYVLTFEGTTSVSDWHNNYQQGSGRQVSAQYENAVSLAAHVRDVLGEDANITYTGHSLGGGLATATALSDGAEAVTFNAARTASKFRGLLRYRNRQ